MHRYIYYTAMFFVPKDLKCSGHVFTVIGSILWKWLLTSEFHSGIYQHCSDCVILAGPFFVALVKMFVIISWEHKWVEIVFMILLILNYWSSDQDLPDHLGCTDKIGSIKFMYEEPSVKSQPFLDTIVEQWNFSSQHLQHQKLGVIKAFWTNAKYSCIRAGRQRERKSPRH